MKNNLFNTKPSFLALTQGKNLVIVLQPMAFFLLKDFQQDKNITILGAFYKNCSIDHNQISRLSKVIEEDQIYYNLNKTLTSSISSFLNKIHNPIAAQSAISQNISSKLCLTIHNLKTKIVK